MQQPSLQQFKQKYIEEVNDMLNDMEGSILTLEQNPSSPDEINQVFRVMHTIKGTSAMYDFKTVEKITHDVEGIYSKIRDAQGSVSKDITTLTLECVDLLRHLLNQPSAGDDALVDDFLARVAAINGGGGKPSAQATATPAESDGGGFWELESDNAKKPCTTYYVMFAPEADITNRGVNIKGILESIEDLGDNTVLTRSWPESEANNGKFYMYWEAIFATDVPFDELNEIFLFVSDEVKIEKIADQNLFLSDDFKEQLAAYQLADTPIDTDELKAVAMLMMPQQPEPQQSEPTKQPEPIKPPEPPKPDPPKAEPPKTEPPAKNQSNAESEQKIIAKNIEASDTKNSGIKVDSEKLDELMNLVSEFVNTKAELLLIAEKYDITELHDIYEKVDKLSNKLKDNALSIRLVPIESLMLRFQRLVRDLSKELGKQVDFVTEGTDTELDKTIIDNLAVPLMHIIRNSIDHGIESVERRRALKKPDHGIIKFTAFYSGNNVFIQVQDDGAGMNPEYLREKAIEKGFIKATDHLTNRQLYDLVFLPGFSTAQKITGISGRGVGMDAVRQHIMKLRGEIDMDSEVDLGTITTIKLPLTLSIVDALLVSVAGTQLLIPVYIIDSCINIHRKDVDASNGRIIHEGEPTPILDLRTALNMGGNPPDACVVVMVKYKDSRVGLVLDKVHGEHQAVLKSLGKYFNKQEYLSGGSILGDGSIALVLDTNKLIRQLQK
ncbi:MAG: chemotaxis protein CheA [Bacteroidales bacterium]|nr:chemotaxis protein CheA [Bacteroidales bacterium]